MARKQTTIKLDDSYGRDSNKIFRLTEMSAVSLEKWHIKAISLLKGTLVKSQNFNEALEGHSATLAFALLSERTMEDSEKYLDLLNELLYCYEIYDKNRGEYVKITDESINDSIEELNTIKYLRDKSAEFNIAGNFQTGEPLNQAQAGAVVQP